MSENESKNENPIVIERLVVGPFQENTYILGDKTCGQAAVIDPGDEAEQILARLKHHGLACEVLLFTHAHIDHVLAAGDLHDQTGAPCVLHPDEKPLWDGIPMQGQAFGVSVKPLPEIGREAIPGETIGIGDVLQVKVLATPGHSPGGVTYALELPGHPPILFVGDTLFAGSIGRTDLWGGDFDTLARSIREQLYAFADETVVLSGHGPQTTIGQERQTNPFVRG